MSEPSPKAAVGNRRRSSGRAKVIEAPLDPLFAGDDSPPPSPATTTVRPPGSPSTHGSSGFSRGVQLVSGVVIVLAASIAVAWGARRYVVTSPRFSIRTVLVDGVRRRTAAHVAEAGGASVGKNIFALDTTSASQLIAQDPWIERAVVTRKLPSTVSILVVEREAYAAAAIGGELYLSTRDGELFKKLGEDDPCDVPVVTGITMDQVAKDRPGVVLAVKRVLDVAEEIERTGVGKRYPIQELHIEKDDSIVVTIGKDAIALHLGMPPYREKIEQASRVLAEVGRRKANASMIFLDNRAHPERVVVRMR